MAGLEVTLFGSFEIRLADGAARELPGQKDRGLLAVLALPPGATHSRDKLAGLLWSDRGDRQARDSLKHALTRLRKGLASADATPIIADRQSVRLDPAAISIDVVVFERLLEDGSLAPLEQAMALYRGDLLDGISVRDPAFDDWLLVERQRLRHLVEEAAANLLRTSLASGALDNADAAARRLLSLDPLREEACRALMQSHSDRGETAQALKLYDALRERLQRELGVKPEPNTSQLYETIRQRNDAPVTTAADVGRSGENAPESAPLPLPDKPSIAVLAFENLSGDPEQDYFADGIVEDIINGLARFHTLFVIARHSTFVYKGQGVKVQDIGRDLGVQYVVEGSVRKSGQRVRVTIQLVEGKTGKHVWAERYDRDLDDIFAVQDEITQAIVSTLPGRLEDAGWKRVKQKRAANMTAYDYVLLGLGPFNRFSREDNLQARRMFLAAIDHDPLYARAHALLASTYIWDLFIYAESDQSLDQAFKSAEAALALDDEDGWSHAMLGFALFLRGQDEEAEIQFRRAVSLNPNDADAIAFMADALIYFGRWEEGLECIVKAKRINPFPPVYYHWYHGLALYSAREYEQAIMAIKQIRPLDRWHHGLLAMCYAQVNRLDEASAEIAMFVDARQKEISEHSPSVSVSDLDLALERVNRYRVQADRNHFLDGLRKAGLSV
jgi:TolB-like protein